MQLERILSISRQRIEELTPGMKMKVRAWWSECLEAGLTPYIYCAYRSPEEQDRLYAIGRSTPGRKVTNAHAWQSFHQYREAIDWVPVQKDVDGVWQVEWDADEIYKHGQGIAEKHGLRWISWETPHLENADFKDWKELKEKRRV